MRGDSRRGVTAESVRTRASNLSRSAAIAATNVGTQAKDVSETVSDIAMNLGSRVTEIVDQVDETLVQARESLNDAKDAVIDSTREAAHQTDRYVTKNPWTAVGIAGGVGLLIGIMIKRRW